MPTYWSIRLSNVGFVRYSDIDREEKLLPSAHTHGYMYLDRDEGHCPRCEEVTAVHTAEPWLGAVCKRCGATV